MTETIVLTELGWICLFIAIVCIFGLIYLQYLSFRLSQRENKAWDKIDRLMKGVTRDIKSLKGDLK